MLYFLDLLGTFAFAITGAYRAKGAKLNFFAVLFLGIITAFGGGTIRDLIINRTPLYYLKDSNYFFVAILGGVIVFFVPFIIKKAYSLFRFVDSIGLAAFVIIGISISFSTLFKNNTDPSLISFLVSILLGIFTGFGGGVIRDSIMGGVPLSLKKGSNYIASSFWGAFSFYFLMFVDIELAIFVSMLITLIFREIVSSFGIYRKLIKRRTISR